MLATMTSDAAPLPPPPLRNADAPPMPAPAIAASMPVAIDSAGSRAKDYALTMAAAACTVLSILLLITWAASRRGMIDHTIQGIGTNLQIHIEEGTLMLGVFENDQQGGRRWFRPPRSRLSDLSPPVSMTASLTGWGFAMPAWVPAVGFALFPTWLIVVHRERRRFRERVESGGCLHCGYDMRASGRICPECGHPAGTLPANLVA
jgi:hypothetical protein